MIERDAVDRNFWRGKRVLLTGHTGFKGSWLAFWLSELGAEVTGYALPTDASPSAFEALGIRARVHHVEGDVRDTQGLASAVGAARPDVVFHLAAQAIVLTSYERPAETFATNVIGTANVLDTLRNTSSTRACVVVTSDKCYENREQLWGYREHDPFGGRDPYSASKACQELVAGAYRQSYFPPDRHAEHGLCLATARAGNVIGGGDWAPHRLVPDLMQAFAEGRPAIVRRPDSVRPWQHVIEPLRGYLVLAQAAWANPIAHARGYNFGPAEADTASVRELADHFTRAWGKGAIWEDRSDPAAPHEAHLLRLDTTLARTALGWRPRMDLDATARATVEWYRQFHASGSSAIATLTAEQLATHGAAQ